METQNTPENETLSNTIMYYEIDWQGIHISIKWEPEYLREVISHLEITSEDSVNIPITDTGYKSHFCNESEIMEHG
jgi:hypothetical protein